MLRAPISIKLVVPSRILWAVVVCALPSLIGQAAFGQPTFPTSGYDTILLSEDDQGILDNVDIVNVGYQQDGTYAFFCIHVVGDADFSNDRFILYIDLDADGFPDRRLLNTLAVNGRLENWSGTIYESFASGWAEDPGATPDDHIYLACLLSDINNGDFALTAVAADLPSIDDDTIRDPNDNPDFDEVTGSSTNPTAVEARDFVAMPDGETMRLTWRLGAPGLVVGFNVYLMPDDGEPMRRINPNLLLADNDATYELLDTAPARGTYFLQVVGPDGQRRMVASVTAPSQ